MLMGFWIDGGGDGPILSLSAWRNALSNANNVKILTIASGSSFLLAIGCAKLLSKISLSEIGVAILSGLKGSLLPTTVLVLAWSLKAVCDELSTGSFLAATVEGVLSPLWFPALLFIVASVTSFATGTSWGTMAILIPTAIPIAFSLDGNLYGLTTAISLGAVLDGSIFGDHCSPISDTTIMSSIASDCDPIHHVHTQLPYSLTVAGLALICGYVPAALGVSPYLVIGVAAALIVLLFYIIGKLDKSQQIVA
jgi:Na+/H+ antiporter NhaC